MSDTLIHLTLRFLVEIASLLSIAYWGWQQGEGIVRYALGLGLPILAGSLWSVFRAPGDPGSAPVPVPGILRLILEAALLALAVWALYASAGRILASLLAILIVVHYVLSYDRIAVLLKK
jgi:hypothetical protein